MKFCVVLPDESQGAHIKPAFHGTDTRNYEPLVLSSGLGFPQAKMWPRLLT